MCQSSDNQSDSSGKPIISINNQWPGIPEGHELSGFPAVFGYCTD